MTERKVKQKTDKAGEEISFCHLMIVRIFRVRLPIIQFAFLCPVLIPLGPRKSFFKQSSFKRAHYYSEHNTIVQLCGILYK